MATVPTDYRSSTELAFGVVAPVGTELDPLLTTLTTHLNKFRYRTLQVRLSHFLRHKDLALKHRVRLHAKPESRRIANHMDAGNELRRLTEMNDLMALCAASYVSQQRLDNAILPSTAHIFLTVKRPEEVSTLRRIYGPGFFLLGVYTPEEERVRYLQEEKEMSESQATHLIRRDEDEDIPYGQRTRATFQLADVFFKLDSTDLDAFQKEVRRFVDLVFGHPHITPTREEQAMFLAHTASLRSGDLSRQVGAVIVSGSGELLATGANDVPRYGGGAYWPGPDDRRDNVLGKDSNKAAIEDLLNEIVGTLVDKKRAKEERKALRRKLANTRLNDLTEFGRIVHAEMDAITSCARKGVSPLGGKMYVTTFPCHNCAKHIVASGLLEVEYIEPYPKSRAQQLHGDSISVDTRTTEKVCFLPYVGIAARRYVDLFSMRLSSGRPLERKAANGVDKSDFVRRYANPRVPLVPVSYIDHELKAASDVLGIIKERGEANGEEGRRQVTKRSYATRLPRPPGKKRSGG